MKIYIYMDGADFGEIAELAAESIEEWLKLNESKAVLVNQKVDAVVEGGAADSEGWRLGLTIDTKKKQDLKKPLEFLHGLAKKFERNFVIGVYDPKSGAAEDVCFFGHDEGRPDVDEVGSYLGL